MSVFPRLVRRKLKTNDWKVWTIPLCQQMDHGPVQHEALLGNLDATDELQLRNLRHQ